jgi:signal transduction histidine kinase
MGDQDQSEISISDTGVGIGEDKIDKIFDPFFTTKEKGTGLGLSIVHSIVESYGGRITVRSQMGRGTTFTIILPIN